MLFTQSAEQRAYERMMTAIPNFSPRGHGVYYFRARPTWEDYSCDVCAYQLRNKCQLDHCCCMTERIRVGMIPLNEVLKELGYAVGIPVFTRRLRSYIKQSEVGTMKYQNERHKMAFKDTSNRTNKRNDILMAVLYLLTADHRLWNLVRPYVDRNEIMFDRIKIKSVSEKAYTLFMTAKDIYLGTDHIHFIDLADTELIDDRMFGLICNGLAIARYGLGAISGNQKEAKK